MGGAVLETAEALDAIAIARELRQPTYGSIAAEMRASDLDRRTTEGNTHVDNAHNMIATSCLAAADHMRAFAMGTASGRTTVSNWTLARGAIEALGRAHYLLGAADTAALLARYVALAHNELRHAALAEFTTRDGGVVDIAQYLRDLTAMLDELQIPKVKTPSLTGMASDVLESASPGSGGRRRYSELSAAAHGQTPGLGMFRTTDSGTLVLPRRLFREASHMQAGCGVYVGSLVVNRFTGMTATRQRWIAHQRSIYAKLGVMPKA